MENKPEPHVCGTCRNYDALTDACREDESVRENRGLRNCGKTAAVQAFEDLWISWVRAGAKRDERGKPVMAEKKEGARSA